MKKITLGIFLVLMGFSAMAGTIRSTGILVSSCGVTWNYVIYSYDDGDIFDATAERWRHIFALQDKVDQACNTPSVNLITNSVDPDLSDPSAGSTTPDAGSNQGPISTLDDQP